MEQTVSRPPARSPVAMDVAEVQIVPVTARAGAERLVDLAAYGDGRLLGTARLSRRTCCSCEAELVISVLDERTRPDVQRQLLGELLREASTQGVRRLHAWVMPGDVAALDLYRRALTSIRVAPDNGLLHVTGVVDDPDPCRITMDDVLADLLW